MGTRSWREDPDVHQRTGTLPAKASAIPTQLLGEGSGLRDSRDSSVTAWERSSCTVTGEGHTLPKGRAYFTSTHEFLVSAPAKGRAELEAGAQAVVRTGPNDI